MFPRSRGPTLAVACAVVLLGLLSVPAASAAISGAEATTSSDVEGALTGDRTVTEDGTLTVGSVQIDGGLDENDTVSGTETPADDDTSLIDDSNGGTPTDDSTQTSTDDGTQTPTDDATGANSSLSVDVGGISIDANLSGSTGGTTNDTSLSVDGRLNAAGTGIRADAIVNDTGVTVDADASVAGGTLNANIDAGTATSRDDGSAVTASSVDAGEGAGTGAGAPVDRDDSSGGLPSAPTAALGAIAVAGGAAAAHRGLAAVSYGPTPPGLTDTLAGGVHWLRTELPRLIVPFGYSRHDDSDPLEHETRAALYDHVGRAPGIHLSALAADVDVSLSSVRHHLRMLEEESLVERHKIRGKRRYFPLGEANPELVAALDDPATASVLRTLAAAEPASVSELADRLGRDPSTISHHLSGLEADGLVERERNGQAVETRLVAETRDVLAVEAETPMPAAAD